MLTSSGIVKWMAEPGVDLNIQGVRIRMQVIQNRMVSRLMRFACSRRRNIGGRGYLAKKKEKAVSGLLALLQPCNVLQGVCSRRQADVKQSIAVAISICYHSKSFEFFLKQ